MQYELEWLYSDDPSEAVESEPYIHFWFLLKFPDVPPGKGHTANFCFNVLAHPETTEPGIFVARRGFLVCFPFSKPNVQNFIETAVAEASKESRDEALAVLNKQFIHSDLDFSDEFAGDLLEPNELLELIEAAFNGVVRGDGFTLHQALVIDDYGSEQEFIAAGKLDTEDRWQEVPDADLSTSTSIFSFLDPAGFRYYLPAAMTWAVRNHACDEYGLGLFTYLAVLPTVAPRDVGRGLGESFDLDAFIERYSFTPPQIKAIYRFLCFMAIRAGLEMDEDQYAAIKKWRRIA